MILQRFNSSLTERERLDCSPKKEIIYLKYLIFKFKYFRQKNLSWSNLKHHKESSDKAICKILPNTHTFIYFNVHIFPVSLWNRLISGGLELVLSHTEKLCIACIISSFLWIKTVFNLIIVHFYIRGKLFMIRCNK